MTPIKDLVISLAFVFFFATVQPGYADNITLGRTYYLRYCAACHGPNADGLGPAARALKVWPPDLRRLSDRYGTPLPLARLARFIDGRDMAAAHGSREMPIWGRRFDDIWTAKRARQPELTGQIALILEYLESIQLAGHPASLPPPQPSTAPPASATP
jgi:mono/diheme cytochrome c family protein